MRAEARTPPDGAGRDATMDMNRDHKSFDLAMELACCLTASFVPLELLRLDLGLATIADVRELLDELRGRGYRLANGYLPGAEGVAVGVAAVSEEKLGLACRAYWRAVNGGQWMTGGKAAGKASARGVGAAA